MEITERDRLYYSRAIELLTQRFEIAREFVRNNGLSSLPMEELTSLMIVGIKEWLVGSQGEEWLSTMGYIKHEGITISGSINISGTLCPVCSGMFPDLHGTRCENCGKWICNPCASIVDPIYQIGWCSECLSKYPLTNLLVYNE